MSKESLQLFEEKLYKATIAMTAEPEQLPELPLSRIYPDADIDPHEFSRNVNIALLRWRDENFKAVTRRVGNEDKSVLIAAITTKLIK